MSHIALPKDVPGILGPMRAYPETEKPLKSLAQALLRGQSSLTPAEREIIAMYVSLQNECHFCRNAHASTAKHLLGKKAAIVDSICSDFRQAPISPRLKALLGIADKVRNGGKCVTDEDVAFARIYGADDKAIHDTVLIAAAFCMFNRYVDGLATWTPEEPEAYDRIGRDLANGGYVDTIR